jgi:hypothetical protein
MGYTTRFTGHFELDRPLYDFEVLYLLEFARTRRVKRSEALLAKVPDSIRGAVGLELGEEGCYFVNESHQEAEASIVDNNRPPKGQPGLHCQWQPTLNGCGIEWNGHEKFYRYVEWLQYIIVHFLARWGYQLNGTVTWQGETASDGGKIVVVNNKIVQPQDAEMKLQIVTSPVTVPGNIWEGLYAVHNADSHVFASWISALHSCNELGYPDTAHWIEENLLGLYGAGIGRGFQNQETLAVFIPTCYPIGAC